MKKTFLEAIVLLVVIAVALGAMYFIFSEGTHGLATEEIWTYTCDTPGTCKNHNFGVGWSCMTNGKKSACPLNGDVPECTSGAIEDVKAIQSYAASHKKQLRPQCVDGKLLGVTKGQYELNSQEGMLTPQGVNVDTADCRCL